MMRSAFLLAAVLSGLAWAPVAPALSPAGSSTGEAAGDGSAQERAREGAAGQESGTEPGEEPGEEPEPAEASASITAIRVQGAITPVTTNYLKRALEASREGGAPVLLVELDTPGGLLESTKNIVQAFFGSPVPVVVYVSPDGARAASAGTFLTMAAHVAAMAPSTTIGAASPVSLQPGAPTDTVMQKKVFSATESFIRTIAERRDRNVEWAISAVREGASATETEALELGVIDLVAEDREDLLARLDGRVVEGDTVRTAGLAVEELPRNLAERLLGLIIRPELMLILMLVAIYGIMGEVSNPGAIVPGVAGVIALVLLLYASAAMPINAAGYLLLALAIALFIAEAFTPTFGLLLGAGSVAFFLGALMLFQDFPEPLELPWAWLIPATILTAAFFVFIAGAGLKAQLAPARTGLGTLVGRRVEVVDPIEGEGGRVFVDGEYWRAVSDSEIPAGAPCEIEGVEGLTLRVRPAADADRDPTEEGNEP